MSAIEPVMSRVRIMKEMLIKSHQKVYKQRGGLVVISQGTADVFPVVASLPNSEEEKRRPIRLRFAG